MSELWALTGPFWRLPVSVYWVESLAQVQVCAGTPLTQKMQEAAWNRLLLVGTVRNEVIWVPREKLETVAQRFSGNDPQDVIEWYPAREKVEPSSDFKPPDDFILEYCKSQYAWIRDPLLADIVWMSFIKFMMHWMLNEHKTLNLVFAEMDALCLRNNWKSHLAMDERMRKKEIDPKDYLKADQASMMRRGVGDFLIKREATALDVKSKTMIYTLEVRETEVWRKMCQKIEKMKYDFHGNRYWTSVGAQLRRQLLRALKAYEFFLKETNRPHADVAEQSARRRAGKFFARFGSAKAVKVRKPWIPDPAMCVPVEQSHEGTEVGAAPVVQNEVRSLQSSGADLRDSRPESLLEPGDGAD